MLAARRFSQSGMSMLEVLITIVIVAFGLLGIAGLQAKTHLAELESFQRAQAIVLMQDMADRLKANVKVDGTNSAVYLNSGTLGTGDSQPAVCTALPAGPQRDVCEWSNALKGSSERKTSGINVGAMEGARGCITLAQPSACVGGVGTPAIYEVAVAWQGMNKTAVSPVTCGQNQYGDESLRHVIATRVSIGDNTCS